MRAAVGSICTAYPFREGRSAPPLTTKLPDRLSGGSSLAGLAAPTRPGFLAPQDWWQRPLSRPARAAALPAWDVCQISASDQAAQPNERPSPRYPCHLGPNPLTGITDGVSLRLDVLGEFLVRKVASVPIFCGSRGGQGQAKGGQQLKEPSRQRWRGAKGVKSSGPVEPVEPEI